MIQNLGYLRSTIMTERNRTSASDSTEEVVLLLNIGSPDSTEEEDVARFLTSFLTDKRIIPLPSPLRHLLVRGLIVPLRKKRSARIYRTIWDKDSRSFPLIRHTKAIAQALNAAGKETYAAMRYGRPSVEEALLPLRKRQNIRLTILSLLPHYAMSSYETAVEHCRAEIGRLCPDIPFRVIPPFYAHEAYIRALSERIRPYLQTPFDKLILSYHGIPQNHLDRTTRQTLGLHHPDGCCTADDPTASVCYLYQTRQTTTLLRQSLGLREDQIEEAFQSRFGHTEWLQPYLADRLATLPSEGAGRVLITSPSFVCDCLETIEEVAEHGKRIFMQAGGLSYTYIPCLNEDGVWIESLRTILQEP